MQVDKTEFGRADHRYVLKVSWVIIKSSLDTQPELQLTE